MTKSEMLLDIAGKLDTLLDLKNGLDMDDPANHGAYFAIVKRMDEFYAQYNTILFPGSAKFKAEGTISHLQKN